MHNADNAADIRLLTDAELDDVNGGVPAAVVAAVSDDYAAHARANATMCTTG